jgi:hypothetical protein
VAWQKWWNNSGKKADSSGDSVPRVNRTSPWSILAIAALSAMATAFSVRADADDARVAAARGGGPEAGGRRGRSRRGPTADRDSARRITLARNHAAPARSPLPSGGPRRLRSAGPARESTRRKR